jgi:hypothetical protein
VRRSSLVAAVLVAVVGLLLFPLGSLGRPTDTTWTGTWSTNFNKMTLKQSGSSVEGRYEWDQGHLTGTISGNKLTGRWDEAPTRKGPSDAGPFEFTLKPDGKSFTGTWRHDGDPPANLGSWTGTCSGGECLKNGEDDSPWPPLPSALVPIDSVANGCGGGAAGNDPKYGDTSEYVNSEVPFSGARKFLVNFREACKLHDAGYSGAKVKDAIHGGVVDFLSWSQKQVDDKFLADMRILCDRQIPAAATTARTNCRQNGGFHSVSGAKSRYNFVRGAGSLFYKERPSFRGLWTSQADPSAPQWAIAQNGRTVKATWRGGAAKPDLRGEFRGTLISRDDDSIVKGYAKITDGGKTAKGAMTFTITSKDLDHFTVSGPGVSGTMQR